MNASGIDSLKIQSRSTRILIILHDVVCSRIFENLSHITLSTHYIPPISNLSSTYDSRHLFFRNQLTHLFLQSKIFLFYMVKHSIRTLSFAREQSNEFNPFSLTKWMTLLIAMMRDERNATILQCLKSAMLRCTHKNKVRTAGNDCLYIKVSLFANHHGLSTLHLLFHLWREKISQAIHTDNSFFQPQSLKVSQLQSSGTNETMFRLLNYIFLRATIFG